MPSTYMQLTNRLLRRVNDIEITEADFPSARGIQSLAKDAILDTVREVNSSRIDWPFNAVQHSQTLGIGVQEYAWSDSFTAADWNSFQIQKDDSLNINHKTLAYISRDEWYTKLRDKDSDTECAGSGVPDFVFPSHGQGWGISPSPNQEYQISYRYYKNPTDLSAYDDQVTIPSKFDYVIMAGALWHMNLFKENIDGASMAKMKFDQGIKDMVNLFLPNSDHAYDTRVNFGGGDSRSGYLFYRGGM